MADKALRTYEREPRRAGSSSAERGTRGEGHLCFSAVPPQRGTGGCWLRSREKRASRRFPDPFLQLRSRIIPLKNKTQLHNPGVSLNQVSGTKSHADRETEASGPQVTRDPDASFTRQGVSTHRFATQRVGRCTGGRPQHQGRPLGWVYLPTGHPAAPTETPALAGFTAGQRIQAAPSRPRAF